MIRIRNFLFLFLSVIAIFFYSVLYHTDKICSYFLIDIIDYANSHSSIFNNLNIKNIEGNLVSSLEINGLSFFIDDNYINIKKYNLESSLVNYINSIKDFFLLGNPKDLSFLKNSKHEMLNISIENKKSMLALAVPNLEIKGYSISLDTLFSSYNQYITFAYNLKGELSDLDTINTYSLIEHVKIDSIYSYNQDNIIKATNFSFRQLDDLSASANNIVIKSNSEAIPLLDELVLLNPSININFINRIINVEIENALLTNSYFEELLIKNIAFHANGKDSSGYLNSEKMEVFFNISDQLTLDNLSLTLKAQSDSDNYIFNINGFNNAIYNNLIKYNFRYNMNYMFDNILENGIVDIDFFDGYDNKDRNFINLSGSIDFDKKDVLLNINTSNFSYFDILPETSKITITSYNLYKSYIVDFEMYKVANLVKKKFDKLAGQSTVYFQGAMNNYLITSTPIFITDRFYVGSITIPDITDVSQYKFNVKSSFVNILKKNKLETVD